MLDSEEILVDKAKAGDLKSFEALVSAYQKPIFAFIYRMVLSVEDARDLTQEVFILVFRAMDQFRGEAKFSSWLYRIASNKSLDFLRSKQKSKIFNLGEIDQANVNRLYTSDHGPEQVYLQEEKLRRLRGLIGGLPDKYRIALVLFHYQNLTYRQIAEALDIPEKTVATRLYRAKLILKERLGGESDELS